LRQHTASHLTGRLEKWEQEKGQQSPQHDDGQQWEQQYSTLEMNEVGGNT